MSDLDAVLPPPVPETADLVAMIVNYARSDEYKDGNVTDWNKVALKLGWELDQLEAFRETNKHLFSAAATMVLMETPHTLPPTDGEILSSPGPDANALGMTPSVEHIAQSIALADANLGKGLEALGLSKKEVDIAQNLQAFNKEHFKESMDMISSGVLVTALKLQGQQREIEERLRFVRDQIKAYGEIPSDERSNWVSEEKLLTYQYIEIGQLLNSIQDTWYKGAAYLAVIRSRLRGGINSPSNHTKGRTQRTNKPGFRPSIIINQDGQEETP